MEYEADFFPPNQPQQSDGIIESVFLEATGGANPTWWLMVVSNQLVSWVITLFRGLSNQLTGVSYSYNPTYN